MAPKASEVSSASISHLALERRRRRRRRAFPTSSNLSNRRSLKAPPSSTLSSSPPLVSSQHSPPPPPSPPRLPSPPPSSSLLSPSSSSSSSSSHTSYQSIFPLLVHALALAVWSQPLPASSPYSLPYPSAIPTLLAPLPSLCLLPSLPPHPSPFHFLLLLSMYPSLVSLDQGSFLLPSLGPLASFLLACLSPSSFLAFLGALSFLLLPLLHCLLHSSFSSLLPNLLSSPSHDPASLFIHCLSPMSPRTRVLLLAFIFGYFTRRSYELEVLTLSSGWSQAQAESSRAVRFVSQLSHELRTPLSAILGWTELLLHPMNTPSSSSFHPHPVTTTTTPGSSRGDETEGIRSGLRVIHRSAQQLLCLLNDLLDATKLGADKMNVDVGSFDLERLVLEVCDTMSGLLPLTLSQRPRDPPSSSSSSSTSSSSSSTSSSTTSSKPLLTSNKRCSSALSIPHASSSSSPSSSSSSSSTSDPHPASTTISSFPLELLVDYPKSVPAMWYGDSGKIRQILCNLMSNAIKYTKVGSITIRVRVHPYPSLQQGFPMEDPERHPGSPLSQTPLSPSQQPQDPFSNLSSRSSLQWVLVEVQDTGAGIPAKRQKELFKEFTQLIPSSSTPPLSSTSVSSSSASSDASSERTSLDGEEEDSGEEEEEEEEEDTMLKSSGIRHQVLHKDPSFNESEHSTGEEKKEQQRRDQKVDQGEEDEEEEEEEDMVAQQPGTGLGLYLVKQLSELMGGAVKMTSKVGKGSTFSFELPLHQVPTSPPSSPSSPSVTSIPSTTPVRNTTLSSSTTPPTTITNSTSEVHLSNPAHSTHTTKRLSEEDHSSWKPHHSRNSSSSSSFSKDLPPPSHWDTFSSSFLSTTIATSSSPSPSSLSGVGDPTDTHSSVRPSRDRTTTHPVLTPSPHMGGGGHDGSSWSQSLMFSTPWDSGPDLIGLATGMLQGTTTTTSDKVERNKGLEESEEGNSMIGKSILSKVTGGRGEDPDKERLGIGGKGPSSSSSSSSTTTTISPSHSKSLSQEGRDGGGLYDAKPLELGREREGYEWSRVDEASLLAQRSSYWVVIPHQGLSNQLAEILHGWVQKDGQQGDPHFVDKIRMASFTTDPSRGGLCIRRQGLSEEDISLSGMEGRESSSRKDLLFMNDPRYAPKKSVFIIDLHGRMPSLSSDVEEEGEGKDMSGKDGIGARCLAVSSLLKSRARFHGGDTQDVVLLLEGGGLLGGVLGGIQSHVITPAGTSLSPDAPPRTSPSLRSTILFDDRPHHPPPPLGSSPSSSSSSSSVSTANPSSGHHRSNLISSLHTSSLPSSSSSSPSSSAPSAPSSSPHASPSASIAAIPSASPTVSPPVHFPKGTCGMVIRVAALESGVAVVWVKRPVSERALWSAVIGGIRQASRRCGFVEVGSPTPEMIKPFSSSSSAPLPSPSHGASTGSKGKEDSQQQRQQHQPQQDHSSTLWMGRFRRAVVESGVSNGIDLGGKLRLPEKAQEKLRRRGSKSPAITTSGGDMSRMVGEEGGKKYSHRIRREISEGSRRDSPFSSLSIMASSTTDTSSAHEEPWEDSTDRRGKASLESKGRNDSSSNESSSPSMSVKRRASEGGSAEYRRRRREEARKMMEVGTPGPSHFHNVTGGILESSPPPPPPLPLSLPPSSPKTFPISSPPVPPPITVLLVDDDFVTRSLLSRQLTLMGQPSSRILMASTAKEALSRMDALWEDRQKLLSEGGSRLVVLMDQHLHGLGIGSSFLYKSSSKKGKRRGMKNSFSLGTEVAVEMRNRMAAMSADYDGSEERSAMEARFSSSSRGDSSSMVTISTISKQDDRVASSSSDSHPRAQSPTPPSSASSSSSTASSASTSTSTSASPLSLIIVLISGDDGLKELPQVQDGTIDAILQKPWGMAELKNTLHSLGLNLAAQ
ncbi:MAG: hypothetical protein DHS80DRAFT_26037 [Piptocephalis tieghemiana]|nr:MAG: hypothetical protein DHS80DRAFT_26037 [Piptocephalis tieghemiana]